MTMTSYQARLANIETALRAQGIQSCSTALILGTGLGDMVKRLTDPVIVPYADIPDMPRSTAPGHEGRFVQGKLGDCTVIMMQGRVHPYEGWSGRDITAPIHVLRRLGVSNLVITNASGGLNPAYRPGQIVAIEDHINLTGKNPLVGDNDESIGPRFPDMSQPYSTEFRRIAASAARESGVLLQSGIYAGVLGPSLETSAERRFLRMAGADLVGMSTVFEVIAARHCGMQVLALAAVTNVATGAPDQQPDTIEEVIANAALAGTDLTTLLSIAIPRIHAAGVIRQ
jgi:purine-nucleoside phosphorylase